MVNGKCSKDYPRSYPLATGFVVNSYPLYMRRNIDGRTAEKTVIVPIVRGAGCSRTEVMETSRMTQNGVG